jgi:type VI secretion system protein ImpA
VNLPKEYFEFNQEKNTYLPFDPKSIDLAGAEAGGVSLLARTHDVRLLVMLAKLAILRRDLSGFAHWLSAIARLLVDHWEDSHPRGEEDAFAVRIIQLSSLDDRAVVIVPLQYAPLAETRRDGALTFRAQLAAAGKITLNENERMPDAATIERILSNSDLEALKRTLAVLGKIGAAVKLIRTTISEKAGQGQEAEFKALEPLVGDMTAFIQTAVARRDSSVAPPDAPPAAPGEDAPAPSAPAQFASLAEVEAALASALGYFVAAEPSSPAVLLIGQARQLLGKNLFEIMKVLAPTQADAARVFVGAEPAFSVLVNSIAPGDPNEAPPSRVEPAGSRNAAIALTDSVAVHLRKVEPSSPIPFLLDRARSLTGRDFIGLLKELLSEEALSQMRQGN